MINFKSPFDSNEIREGLISIKQSQMELLKQLKDQNLILKKYTPDNPIYEDKNQSNLYTNSSLPQSPHSNFQSNQKPSFLPANSFLSNNQKDEYPFFHLNSPKRNTSTFQLQTQLEKMTEDFHRMKKNFFTEKQKNKDMVLHMEFAASLHNTILKDVLQGVNLESIKSKIRNEVKSYQSEFDDFRAFGLQQAFNIINLQSDMGFAQSRPSRRTAIFPSRFQQQNSDLLKQLNEMKSELRQLSLQKQRRTEQVKLITIERDYNLQIMRKQLQMKTEKMNELVGQNIRLRESVKILQRENNELIGNVNRLKSELQRNLNKVETLQNYQHQTISAMEKEHQLIKKIQALETKINSLEKQTNQKSKLIQIHQTNITNIQTLNATLKAENDKAHSQLKQLTQQISKKTQQCSQLQQTLSLQKAKHQQQLALITKQNQTEQASLKQHISQLKLNLDHLLKLQHSFKVSQQNLHQIKTKKIQNLKLSKTVDHLWKIKEVQYDNANQILTQLNLVKIPQNFHNYDNLPEGQGRNSKIQNNIVKKPSRSKSKQNKKKP